MAAEKDTWLIVHNAITNVVRYMAMNSDVEEVSAFADSEASKAAKLVEQKFTAYNTGSPKFCFNCKPRSVLEKKMVDSAYSYCPYCGAKLRAGA